MTRKLCSLLAATMLVGVSAPAMAEPGGCLKYGAAGAAAGHLAHHHGVLGAVGGCAVGMYKRHQYRKDVAQKAAAFEKEHAADAKNAASSASQQAQQAATAPAAAATAPVAPQTAN